jgi:hypothetical protein
MGRIAIVKAAARLGTTGSMYAGNMAHLLSPSTTRADRMGFIPSD